MGAPVVVSCPLPQVERWCELKCNNYENDQTEWLDYLEGEADETRDCFNSAIKIGFGSLPASIP